MVRQMILENSGKKTKVKLKKCLILLN